MTLVMVLLLPQLADAKEAREDPLVLVLLVLREPLSGQLCLEVSDFNQELLHLPGLRGGQPNRLLVAMHHLRRKLPRALLQLCGTQSFMRRCCCTWHCDNGVQCRPGLRTLLCAAEVGQQGGGEGIKTVFNPMKLRVRLQVPLPVAAGVVETLLVVHDLLGDALQLINVREVRLLRSDLCLEPGHAPLPLTEEAIFAVCRQALLGQDHMPLLLGLRLQLLERLLGLGCEPRRLLGLQGQHAASLGAVVAEAAARKEAMHWRQALGHATSVNVPGLHPQRGNGAATLGTVVVVLLASERCQLGAERRNLGLRVALELRRGLLHQMRRARHGPGHSGCQCGHTRKISVCSKGACKKMA
mmetsp:Transcript_132516/g.369442  ORF Transcript_132516/g.369442 Transcript_132516/m.369442 type:complete len:356 (+) Transcript_132516:563-1630(+)